MASMLSTIFSFLGEQQVQARTGPEIYRLIQEESYREIRMGVGVTGEYRGKYKLIEIYRLMQDQIYRLI